MDTAIVFDTRRFLFCSDKRRGRGCHTINAHDAKCHHGHRCGKLRHLFVTYWQFVEIIYYGENQFLILFEVPWRILFPKIIKARFPKCQSDEVENEEVEDHAWWWDTWEFYRLIRWISSDRRCVAKDDSIIKNWERKSCHFIADNDTIKAIYQIRSL